MAAPKRKLEYSPEEYLAFEREAETKHEYLDGRIYAMAGASPLHNQISFNVSGELHRQLKGSACVGYTSDQRIRTDAMDLFAYPDLTIVCGEPIFHDDKKDVILNPTVIIEVLSPSTESYDRNEKFLRYQNLSSLSDYILIAQNHPAVEHFIRQKGKRQWLYTLETEMEAVIQIASIKCTLKLADIYDRVKFPPLKPPLAAIENEQSAPTKKKTKKSKAR